MHASDEVHLRPQTYDVLKYLVERRAHLVSKDKLIEPEAVEKYLKTKFGDAVPQVRAAMEELAKSVPPKELRAKAYTLYGQFTPQVPTGMQGWGARGELDVARIRALCKK